MVPVADQTQNGLTWGADFEAGKVGILPGDYGFATKLDEAAAEFADAPLPARERRQLQHVRRRRRLRDPGRRAQPVRARGSSSSGRWSRSSRSKYPSEGMTPVRSDVLTPAFAATNPYDAVALKALAKGSVEYTLAYDAVFNEPGSPWFKMFEDAVYNGNLTAGIAGRAIRHPEHAGEREGLSRIVSGQVSAPPADRRPAGGAA